MSWIESESIPYETKYFPTGWKQCKCIWCPEKILKGEFHWHFAGYHEGEKQNWRMHVECYKAFQSTRDKTDGSIYNHAHKRGQIEVDEEGGYY